MNYLVLDLETANSDCSSICQIGIVTVEAGEIVGRDAQFVDPCAEFHPWNIRIHGIRPEQVRGAPTYSDLFDLLAPRLTDRIVVTHGSFDRTALDRACDRHGLPRIAARWLDNTRVVRRTWPEFSRRGYGLGNLTSHFGIPLRHHDALEDAVATAAIFRMALDVSGRTASSWYEDGSRA